MFSAMPTTGPKKQPNYSMNAIRFGAAFLVVIFHLRTLFVADYADATIGGPFTVALYAIMSFGHQAVIVFFVLSGYWVGGSVIRSVQQGRFTVAEYASKRLVRLWIVLIPAIGLTLILDTIGRSTRGGSDIYTGSAAYHSLLPSEGVSAHTSVLTTLGNVFFVQDIYAPTIGSNSPLWSLAAEFWYYLIFPAVIVLIWRRVARRTRVLAGGVVAIAIAIIALGPLEHSSRVLILAPAWALGAIVAWLSDGISAWLHQQKSLILILLRVVVGAGVAVSAVIDSRVWNTGTTYALALVSALWIATLITDVRSNLARAVLRPFSEAAEWSYSLYAIHLPILALLASEIVPLSRDRWQLTPGNAFLCLLIALVPLLAAMAFYWAFEKRTDNVRKMLVRNAPDPALERKRSL
jgi:peptidoglycan/LPS O-acetylase OafA/YrhL